MVDFRCRVSGVLASLSVLKRAPVIAVSPSIAAGSGFMASITTSSVTASSDITPSAYAWVFVSGDAFSVDSPSSATTTWTASGMTAGESREAVYRCDITIDGSIYPSPSVIVSAERFV